MALLLQVNWHTVYWSLGMQFVLAVLVMRWQGGKDAVLWVQARLDEFFANSAAASKFMFGESYRDHYMVFGVSTYRSQLSRGVVSPGLVQRVLDQLGAVHSVPGWFTLCLTGLAHRSYS